MIQILLLALFIGVAYQVASEGPQNAAITFLSVLFSGLLAMNFFEPAADLLSTQVLASYEWQHYWDIIALLGLFAASVTLMRLAGEKLFPTYAKVAQIFYHPGRWILGCAAGYTTMAIILTSLHVAPLPREFLGFRPEASNFLGVAPDRQWLALTQFVSERSLRRRRPDGSIPIFDGVQFPASPNLANPGDLSTSRIWSSFPIRYAARREKFTTGTVSANVAGGSTSTPPSNTKPPSSGGGF